MPLYEYRCENCGEVFEVMQKFVDEPLATHAKCGGKVNRLISTSALQFKGSGWYVNDYAKVAQSGKSAESGNGEAKKTDSPAGSTSGSESSSTTPSTTTSSSDTKTKSDSSSDKK